MIHLDFETFSAVNLKDVGAYRYAQDASTELLLASWAFGDGPVDTWRVDRDVLVCPPDLADAIAGGELIAAWNAQFERAMWHYVLHQRHGWPDVPVKQWYCVAAQAAALALPRGLERALLAVGLRSETKAQGTKLKNIFTKPRKPTKKNTATRWYPADKPQEWEEFVTYNIGDVHDERRIYNATPKLSDREHGIFRFDMRVNERGLPIDVPLVRKAIAVARHLEAENKEATQAITGVNSTQNAKVRAWLNANIGDSLGDLFEGEEALENLQRKQLEEFLKLHAHALPQPVLDVLTLRMEGARVSVKKLLTMLIVTSVDGRARGTLLYWGARTGRWAGKLIQPHNFVRGLFTKTTRAWVLELLERGTDALQDLKDVAWLMEGAGPLAALSNVMRGFIAASDGNTLYVVDYANIESRIVVWLAGQEDVLEMYRRKVDLYRWMGSHVYSEYFGRPVRPEDITSEERRVAKHIVLGCGFGMGPPKFVWTCKEQGGFDIELPFAELCVDMYRKRHAMVKKLWRLMQDAAIQCVRTGKDQVTAPLGRIMFFMEGSFLRMQLPSGRVLSYPYPKLFPGMYGEELTYMSENPKTRQWEREKTYGGKLVENAVQAIARDILVEGAINAERAGYALCGTVHDELITERPLGTGNLHEFEQLVCRMPAWADGCPIVAEGFTAKRWRKQ